MKDELARSQQLRIVNLDPAYFFEYRVEDTHRLPPRRVWAR